MEESTTNPKYKKFILQKGTHSTKALFSELSEKEKLNDKREALINNLSKAEVDIAKLSNPRSIDEALKRINVLKSITTLKLQLGVIVRMETNDLQNLLPREIKSVDIVKEMSLIMMKRSTLSAAMRNIIQEVYNIRQLRLRCKEIVVNAQNQKNQSVIENINTISDGEFVEKE